MAPVFDIPRKPESIHKIHYAVYLARGSSKCTRRDRWPVKTGIMAVIRPRPTGHNAQRWSGIIGARVVKIKGFRAYIQVNITLYTPTMGCDTGHKALCPVSRLHLLTSG